MDRKIIGLFFVLIFLSVCFAQVSKQPMQDDNIQQDAVSEDIPFVLKNRGQNWEAESGVTLSQVEGALKFNWIFVSSCGYSEDDIKIKYIRHSDSKLEIRAITKPFSDYYLCLFTYEIEGEIGNLAAGSYSIDFIFEKGSSTPKEGSELEKLNDGSFRYKDFDIQYQVDPTVKKEFTIE